MEYFIARQQPQRLSVDFTVAVIVMHRTSEKTAAVSTVQALAPMTWTFSSALPIVVRRVNAQSRERTQTLSFATTRFEIFFY